MPARAAGSASVSSSRASPRSRSRSDQTATQDPPDCRRGRRRQGGPVGLALEHLGEDLGDGRPLKRPAAGEALVEDAAEAPHVGPAIHGLALRLLRTHVGRRAENHPGDGARRGQRRRCGQVNASAGGLRRQRLGQTEVEHLDLPVGRELHVRRLEIAVDHARLVRGLERGGDLTHQLDRLVDRNRTAGQPLGQVLALDKLHRQEARGRLP